MKLYPDRFTSLLSQQLPRVLLVFGPEAAVADYCVDQVLAKIRQQEKALEIQRFPGAEVVENPNLVIDHLSGGLFRQGAAVVMIDEVTDRMLAPLEPLFEGTEGWIILRGPNLKTTSKWVKYAESVGQTVWAVGCYSLDIAMVRAYLQQRCQAEGYTLAPGVDAAILAQASDFTLFTSFLDRLLLFTGATKTIDEDAVRACQTPGATKLNEWLEAFLNNDLTVVAQGIDSLVVEDPMLCLRSLAGQLMRLQQAHGLIQEAGGTLTEAMLMQLKPPVFAKQAPQFRKWLTTWPPAKLHQAIKAVYQAELAFKTGQPMVVMSRLLMRPILLLEVQAIAS